MRAIICFVPERGRAAGRSLLITAWFVGLAILPFSNFGGITGSLSGKVTDGETGEPLVGAEVLIEGTHLGAATTATGFYIIHNVHPGSYTVRARMMGYEEEVRTGVHILMDLRTVEEFALKTKVLPLGQRIVVTAERPLIQRDITFTSHFIPSDKLASLPIRSCDQAIHLQPGVAAGHVRGGRTEEVLYLVDGIPVEKVLFRSKASELPKSSVVELTLYTGGFSAEYGNAMSGVVNLLTKSGRSSRRTLYLRSQSDGYPLGFPSSWGTRAFEINSGGPLASAVKYFFSGDYLASDTRHGEAMKRVHSPPMEWHSNLTGKLTIYPDPSCYLSLQGLYSRSEAHQYEHLWQYHLEGLPHSRELSYRLSASWNHQLSASTFYKVIVSRYDVYSGLLGKATSEYEFLLEYDSTGTWIVDGDKPAWRDAEEIINLFKTALTTQLSENHQLKAGLDFTYYDLYMDNVQYEMADSFTHINVYNTRYRYFPKAGAVFLQDRVDYGHLVVNAGVRLDLFDPTASRPATEEPPEGGGTEVIIRDERVPASLKWQLSPRVGVSHPTSERGLLFLNYGHFFQMPQFHYLYTNPDYDFSGWFPLVGNPDLKPEQTIAYEVGYKHRLAENLLAGSTLFHKDVKNLVDTRTFRTDDMAQRARSGTYTKYINLAYGTVSGLELFLRKRRTGLVGGALSYTYMQAKGSSSSAGEGYNRTIWGFNPPPKEYYLSWDQRHTLVFDLELRREGVWGVNFVWRWNGPRPYTYRPDDDRPIADPSLQPNQNRMFPTYYVDVKANGTVRVGRASLSPYLQIFNVLDTKNLLWVDQQGRPGGAIADPDAWDTERRLELGIEIAM